jgi:hypothetical protein
MCWTIATSSNVPPGQVRMPLLASKTFLRRNKSGGTVAEVPNDQSSSGIAVDPLYEIVKCLLHHAEIGTPRHNGDVALPLGACRLMKS